MSLLEKLGFGRPVEMVAPRAAHEGVRASNTIIIDVRNPDEWDSTGTPKGAHRFSMQDATFADKVKTVMREQPNSEIVLSCKSGMRSNMAIKMLNKAGLNNLKSLDGGIEGWNHEDLPLDN